MIARNSNSSAVLLLKMAPVYRPLRSVLEAHANTIEVVHTLTPRIVVMAGGDEFDPYKD